MQEIRRVKYYGVFNILLDLKEIPLYAISPCSVYGHSVAFI